MDINKLGEVLRLRAGSGRNVVFSASHDNSPEAIEAAVAKMGFTDYMWADPDTNDLSVYVPASIIGTNEIHKIFGAMEAYIIYGGYVPTGIDASGVYWDAPYDLLTEITSSIVVALDEDILSEYEVSE